MRSCRALKASGNRGNNPSRVEPRSTLLVAIGVWLAAAGCGAPGRLKVLPAPSAESAARGTGDDVRVLLLWAAPVDLDVYVTDPTQETVYFANTPSRTGGRLERDAACPRAGAGDGPEVRTETAVWQKARPGHYRVGVDFIDRCGSGVAEVEYRVIAEVRGKRLERVGRAKPRVFEYVALEFDVQGP